MVEKVSHTSPENKPESVQIESEPCLPDVTACYIISYPLREPAPMILASSSQSGPAIVD